MYKDQMRLSLCDMKIPWREVSESLFYNLRTGFGGCDECKVSLVDFLFLPSYRVIFTFFLFGSDIIFVCSFSTFNDWSVQRISALLTDLRKAPEVPLFTVYTYRHCNNWQPLVVDPRVPPYRLMFLSFEFYRVFETIENCIRLVPCEKSWTLTHTSLIRIHFADR